MAEDVSPDVVVAGLLDGASHAGCDSCRSVMRQAADQIVLLQDLLAERDLYIGARDREVERLRGIVQRVNDGWTYVSPRSWSRDKGVWIPLRVPDGEEELMSEDVQRTIYGSVVREETA